jgi:macrolide transport system ATP-binding/permease protein
MTAALLQIKAMSWMPAATDPCFSDWNRVSPTFLDSIGVPVLRGRGFAEEDEVSRLPVALVNQAFVRRFFPNQNPLEQHFGANGADYAGAFEIVGVFADFKLSDARREAQPLFLRPLGQLYTGYKETNSQAAEAIRFI